MRLLYLLPTFLIILTSFTLFDKGPKPLKIGKSMPKQEVKMMNVDGSSYSLAELKGDKGVLVIFSCNTCPFVVGTDKFAGWEVQYNAMNELSQQAGVNMVLVNSNEAKRDKDDSFESMKIRTAEKGYTMKYLLDSNSELANAFGAKTTPHVYLFDKELKLIYTGSIDNTWDGQRATDITYLKDALNLLGKGEKIKENNTVPRGCSIKRK